MLTKVFYLWFLLVPFSWIISFYIPIIAPDKIMAPLLLLLSVFILNRSDKERISRIVMYSFLVLVFIIVKNISFMASGDIFFSLIWIDAINVGYFIVPILYITNIKQFQTTGWIIVFLAIVGCISGMMVALGWLTLPIERFDLDRLDSGLKRAIGIFPSYGDLAQFLTFAVLWVIILPGVKNTKSFKIKLIRFIVFISFIIGLISSQSRSVFLSVVLGIIIYNLLKRINQAGISMPLLIMCILGTILGSIMLYFSSEIVYALTNMGGGSAAHTAEGRLDQYAFGWEVISKSPLFGADIEDYRRGGQVLDVIHNMWIRLTSMGGIVTSLLLAAFMVHVFFRTRAAAYTQEKRKEVMVTTGYFGALVFSTMFYPGMTEKMWALFGVAASLTCIPPYNSSRRKRSTANTAPKSIASENSNTMGQA